MGRMGERFGKVEAGIAALQGAVPATYQPRVTSPVRMFDVVFQPSVSHGVALFYTIIGGSGNATYDLLVDDYNPPTTVRASAPLSQNQVSNLVFYVGAKSFVKVQKTGPGSLGTLMATEVIF